MGLVLSWSGGKDSALALWTLRREERIEPVALLTTVTEEYARISMHGVRRELLAAQAAAVGLPVVEVLIPTPCPNDAYEQRMLQALASSTLAAAEAVAFGDLFLEDVRAYRVQRLGQVGKRAVFPLWGRDTGRLARAFIDAGFEAVLVCVDPRRLDPSFAGRRYDAELLKDLPAGVDPCGENGEFHTFVHAGPIFEHPIPHELGDVVMRDGFAFCDVLEVAPGLTGGLDDAGAGSAGGDRRRAFPEPGQVLIGDELVPGAGVQRQAEVHRGDRQAPP
jgi:uncharacterized protein (TIGR00290 family)